MKAALKADDQLVSATARNYIPKSSLLDHVSSRVIHDLKPYTKAYLSPKRGRTLSETLH